MSRIRRHLTYANVMATTAVFLVLGGIGYAAATINGKDIKKHSEPGAADRKSTKTIGIAPAAASARLLLASGGAQLASSLAAWLASPAAPVHPKMKSRIA